MGFMARCVAMLLAVGGAVGCGGSDDRSVLLQETLAQDRLWRRTAPARYELAISLDCFCAAGDARSVVDHGQVVESAPSDGEPVTVDWLFTQVQSRLARGFASADVAYDPALGYPTAFWIDPDRNTIDEEFGFHVTCFASGDSGESHCGADTGVAPAP